MKITGSGFFRGAAVLRDSVDARVLCRNDARRCRTGSDTARRERCAANEQVSGIVGVLKSAGKVAPVGLNEELFVQVGMASRQRVEWLDAVKYALFFQEKEVVNLPDPTIDTDRQSLVFELKRNDKNRDLWTALLGAG
jgi:hypothetical protein